MKHITIVEDDPAQLYMLKLILTHSSYDFSLYIDPRDLISNIDIIETDLFILDLLLPHISGVSLCKIIRENSNFKSTSIIALTADARNQPGMQLFNKIIEKPVRVNEFLNIIKNQLE